MPNAASISNADLSRALRELERVGEFGLSRKEFETIFGSDRRGRALMSELRKRGMAAVVVAKRGKDDVYRIARDYDEFRAYVNSLKSRVTELQDAIEGLRAAWQAGGKREPQKELL